MRITIVLVLLLARAAAAVAAAPLEELAKPPASAQHFTVLSTAGKHGDSTRWTTPTTTPGLTPIPLRMTSPSHGSVSIELNTRLSPSVTAPA